MIILEGPDGAGKTTLLRNLDLPQRPRFATSAGGPMNDLYARVYADFMQVFRNDNRVPECGVYDRHSLISEYIYGQIMPDREVPPDFLWPSAKYMLEEIRKKALLVLALPPLHVVKENLHKEVQLPGLHEQIFRIYQAYQVFRVTGWPERNLIVYDYTSRVSVATTRARINQHITEWNNQ